MDVVLHCHGDALVLSVVEEETAQGHHFDGYIWTEKAWYGVIQDLMQMGRRKQHSTTTLTSPTTTTTLITTSLRKFCTI